MTLLQKLESKFDPSDVDNAMGLAYESLDLLRLVQRVLDDEGLVRLGRDQRTELAVRMRRVACMLRLLPPEPSGVEADEFHRRLAPPQEGK